VPVIGPTPSACALWQAGGSPLRVGAPGSLYGSPVGQSRIRAVEAALPVQQGRFVWAPAAVTAAGQAAGAARLSLAPVGYPVFAALFLASDEPACLLRHLPATGACSDVTRVDSLAELEDDARHRRVTCPARDVAPHITPEGAAPLASGPRPESPEG
jgi:hypothetical protein